jgi:hypothetical protein
MVSLELRLLHRVSQSAKPQNPAPVNLFPPPAPGWEEQLAKIFGDPAVAVGTLTEMGIDIGIRVDHLSRASAFFTGTIYLGGKLYADLVRESFGNKKGRGSSAERMLRLILVRK